MPRERGGLVRKVLSKLAADIMRLHFAMSFGMTVREFFRDILSSRERIGD